MARTENREEIEEMLVTETRMLQRQFLLKQLWNLAQEFGDCQETRSLSTENRCGTQGGSTVRRVPVSAQR